MAKCGIYKIQNIENNKIYIGQSVDIAQRWREHRSDALTNRDNSILHKAIKKYGEFNFSYEIIEECLKEELDEKEIYWINYFNSMIPNGYNQTPGGCSGQGEIFRKPVLQYDLKGNFIQEFESASEAARQVNVFKSNLTAACRGEVKQCGGYQWKYKDDKKEIKIVPEKGGKIVYQYDKQLKLIAIFTSAIDAEKNTGVKAGNIRQCCSGRSKTAGGFIWKYKKEGENNGNTAVLPEM